MSTVNKKPSARGEGTQFNRSSTLMTRHASKVDLRTGNHGPSHRSRNNGPESKPLTFLAAIFARFKRADVNNGEQLAAAYMKIDRLQQDISVLQERCAQLQDASYSPYASYQSSVVDITKGHQRVDVALPHSITCPTEDSDSNRTTMDSIVTQIQARPQDQVQAEGVDPPIQPHMAQGSAKDESNSPTLSQNQSVVALAASDTAAPARRDRERGLSDTNKLSGIQPSYPYQHRLPRKKKEDKDLNAEVVEVQPGYIDQSRSQRKELDNRESEVETLRSHVHHERLPRKREYGERDGARSG